LIEDSHEWSSVNASDVPPRSAKVLSTQRKMNMIDDGDAHLPIITLEALITAEALSPTFRPSSSTASFVIVDVNVIP
jgi:hypothetical protein